MKKKSFLKLALVGQPNAGKSTLTNRLLGEEMSLVSEHPQTTRKGFEGLAQFGDFQLMILDAPGFVRKGPGMFSYLESEAERRMQEAHWVAAVVGLDTPDWSDVEKCIGKVRQSKKPWIMVVTKTDLKKIQRQDRLRLFAQEMGAQFYFEFSKLRKHSTKPLVDFLASKASDVEEFPFDPDNLTTQNLREMSAEFVREQCFLNLKGEIPFGIAVEIREFKEGPVVKIAADIWVKKENHKKIVIGKEAQMLKKIGTAARKKIEKYVGQKVFLELQVVSNPQWDLKKSQMKAVGLK